VNREIHPYGERGGIIPFKRYYLKFPKEIEDLHWRHCYPGKIMKAREKQMIGKRRFLILNV
jgi:hypothetical protein